MRTKENKGQEKNNVSMKFHNLSLKKGAKENSLLVVLTHVITVSILPDYVQVIQVSDVTSLWD